MNCEKYCFAEIAHADSRYIFQLIKNRKLSDLYHSHDFYEFITVLEGECTQVINECELVMRKNSCVLLCPDDRHRFICQSDNVTVLALSVERGEVTRFESAFGIGGGISPFFETLSSRQARAVFDFCDADSEYDYKLLLANLIKIYTDSFNAKDDIPPTLKAAVKKMQKEENLRGGIERFCELSKYSRSHLTRLMKKYYNISLHEFILNARLEAAYNALCFSMTDMEELSESLGYASFSHFNKIFKQKYGITPAALRRSRGFWTT